MELLSALVRGLPEYPRLLEAAKAGQTTSVYGASPVHRAHLTAALLSDLPQRTFCVVLRDEQAAKTFAADLQALSGIEPALLPCVIWYSTIWKVCPMNTSSSDCLPCGRSKPARPGCCAPRRMP